LKKRHFPQPILIFIALIVLICAAPAWAAEIPYGQVADNFLKFRGSAKTVTAVEILEGNAQSPGQPKIVFGRLFRLQDGGFLLMADSTDLTPIKAYSLTSNFETLPPPYRAYLLREMEANARVALAKAAASGAVRALSVSDTQASWLFLQNYNQVRQSLSYTADTALLQTTWDQGYPYNKFTPRINGASTYTGCVSTAVAQVMKYHRWPASGRGVASYTWSGAGIGQTLKAILFKDYRWDDMPNQVEAATPAWQADQVASLMSDLGIANETDFRTSASSAYIHTQALIRNFGYAKTMAAMSNTNIGLFFTTLKQEIDAGRPVLLTFPGHMTVADGYASDGSGRKIHVNMGWGGTDDNFYYLDGPPVVYGTDDEFPTGPGLLSIDYGIKPCSGSDCDWAAPAGPDVAPVINTVFPNLVLNSTPGSPFRIYVDGRDENGDALSWTATTSNGQALQAALAGGILSLTPTPGADKISAKVTVAATAAGKTIQASFVTLLLNETVGFGKTFSMAGRFTSQGQEDRQSVILDGNCRIEGDRGYSTQGFYTSVVNASGNAVTAVGDTEINQTFARGRYTVTASLTNSSTGSYYPFTAGDHDAYSINITCPNADERVETVAAVLQVDLRGANALRGDVNGDGFVNLADAVLAFRIMNGLAAADPTVIPYADANGDYRIGLADIIYILQKTAGLR